MSGHSLGGGIVNHAMAKKKNVRDRVRSLRMVTATHMFILLDKFSLEKNAAAPSIYKTLIFSLVESPQD